VEWILWAAVIWAGTFVSAGFAIWNHTGIWRALSHDNAAFLSLSRERSLRELRAVRFGRWFLAVQLAIVVAWFSLDFALHRMTMSAYFFGGALTVLMATGYLQWFSYRERHTRRELAQLDQLSEGQ
jgi:drug/metabolite transporter (DMT)-like permease